MPWQKADLERLGVEPADAARAAWWVEPSGRRLRGHRAIGAALAACGGVWRLAGRVLLLPPPVAWVHAGAYAVIARLRGLLPGIKPACRQRYAWDAARDRPCRPAERGTDAV
jgi:predicted DCC family thiol-disulfide oxidoreductase YuxK